MSVIGKVKKDIKKGKITNQEMFELNNKIIEMHEIINIKTLVDELLSSKKYCFIPLSGRKDIGKIVGNQNSTTSGSLAELGTNSFDAMRSLVCHMMGIDPCSSNAPQNVKEADEKFFGIPDGNLFNCIQKDRLRLSEYKKSRLSKNDKTLKGVSLTKLAGDIVITILDKNEDGSNTVIFYDKGEGQAPDKVRDTLLYYGESTKKLIRWMHGKWDQGGMSVYVKCGDYEYVYILTVRHPEICKLSELNQWTFTIIRKHLSIGEKTDYYEYLCMNTPGKDLLTFTAKNIPNALFSKRYTKEEMNKNILNKSIDCGTYIKLFNFDMGGLNAQDLREVLQLDLYQPSLPIRIDDGKRTKKELTRQSWYAYGALASFAVSKWINPMYEDGIPFELKTSKGISFPGIIIIFKNYLVDSKGEKEIFRTRDHFIRNYRKVAILFGYNGQKHAKLNQVELRNLKFESLKDKLLIIVDLEDLMSNSLYRTKFARTDRETLYPDHKLVVEVKSLLIDTLNNVPILKKVADEYYDEKTAENMVEKDFKKNIKKFIQRYPNIMEKFLNNKTNEFLKGKGTLRKQIKNMKVKIPIKKSEKTMAIEDIVPRSENPEFLDFLVGKKVKLDDVITKNILTTRKIYKLRLRTDAGIDDINIEFYKKLSRKSGGISKGSSKQEWKQCKPKILKGLSESVLTLTFLDNKVKEGDIHKVILKLIGKTGDVKKEKIAKIIFNVPMLDQKNTKTIRKGDFINNLPLHNLVKIDNTQEQWKRDGWTDQMIARWDSKNIYVNMSTQCLKEKKDNKKYKSRTIELLEREYKYYVYLFTWAKYMFPLEIPQGNSNQEIDDELIFDYYIKLAVENFFGMWRPV